MAFQFSTQAQGDDHSTINIHKINSLTSSTFYLSLRNLLQPSKHNFDHHFSLVSNHMVVKGTKNVKCLMPYLFFLQYSWPIFKRLASQVQNDIQFELEVVVNICVLLSNMWLLKEEWALTIVLICEVCNEPFCYSTVFFSRTRRSAAHQYIKNKMLQYSLSQIIFSSILQALSQGRYLHRAQ